MGTADLRAEAVLFSRYLIGADPSKELVGRYERANQILFGDGASAADSALLAFARRHPWSIPLLDAGTAVLDGHSLLRKKLLVMMAILETTPEFARRTEPWAAPLLPLALRVAAAGAIAAVHLVAGLALSRVVIGRRHEP